MAPNPAPSPPADFASRDLPIDTLPRGTALVRIHRATREALYFGRSGDNRFDDPQGRYGVCYAARTLEGAFAEIFLRQTGARLVPLAALAERSATALITVADLRVCALHGPGLARMGATAFVSSGTYDVSQPWSRAIHDHPAEVDGITYRSNHDNSELCAALFERCGGKLRTGAAEGLLDDRARLAALLDRYGVGVG